jgi:hypothetical protein
MGGQPDVSGPPGRPDDAVTGVDPSTSAVRSAAEPLRRAVRYEFLVAGRLSDTVLAEFPELQASRGAAGGTALYGAVEDSAHLHGLLSRFETLGITIVEMRQLPD